MKEKYVEIDCSKNITETKFNKFFKLLSENHIESVICMQTEVELSLNEFFNYLFTLNVDDTYLSFVASVNDLTINLLVGKETLLWWRNKEDRWTKLLNTQNDNKIYVNDNKVSQIKSVKLPDVYHFAIANYEDGKLINIKYCVDNKKSAIEFLNNEIKDRVLSSLMKAEVLIDLCFDEVEYEKTHTIENLNYWFSVKELEEMGMVELA